jgi:hypothetical protein
MHRPFLLAFIGWWSVSEFTVPCREQVSSGRRNEYVINFSSLSSRILRCTVYGSTIEAPDDDVVLATRGDWMSTQFGTVPLALLKYHFE